MVTARALAFDVTQPGAAAMAIDQDWHALGAALSNLGMHLAAAAGITGSSTGLLQWLAVIAAIYLLVLDRTNWRTNLLTALLVPYLALQLPEVVFDFLRGGIGAWIAFAAVVIRLFFAQSFPNLIHGDLELPVAFILLVVTAPKAIVHFRGHFIGEIVCLVIGAYLLYQHTNHAGGFRRAFAETRGVRHTVGILLLFVAPAWSLLF
ncbi:cold-regulated 413 plasma membrane protein 1 [Physcomitrium patens]|uniref:Cold acclimation protein WCOR413-like protein n=1 Tax=Physcomitrium patens TaxID=3218 RepID=A9RWC5_PHYPA|nr:cold-regulated 413 plasma membrane protein 1-like [Physcomitrium patens]PNR47147.1 hypothetical protein PHYPA_014267 [Physcomitrium patens]|eukprot:XP_024385780.1 cold-regulated 413 plasma membrane protein 1-like [Physcomitrella patens]